MTEVESRPRAAGTPVPRLSRTRLTALRVDELRRLAVSLGIGNTSTMRKGSLVDAIDEQYDTTPESEQETPAPAEEQTPEAQQPAEALPETVTAAEDAVDEGSAEQSSAAPSPAEEAPAAGEAPADEAPADDSPAQQEAVSTQVDPVEPQTERHAAETAEPAAETAEPAVQTVRVDEAEGGAEISDAVAQSSGTNQPKSAATHVNAGITGIAEDLEALQRGEQADRDAASAVEEQPAEGERTTGRRGRGRGRGRGNQAEKSEQPKVDAQAATSVDEQQAKADAPAKAEPAQQNQPKQQGNQQQGNQANQPQDGQADGDGRRGRYRDRKRRGQGTDWDEPEIRDDDVLIPIAGILDVLDNYAFVRTSGYLSGTNDVYVSLGQVKKYHLRRGDAVVGAIRQVQDTEQPSRQKYNALMKVDSINGLPVAEAEGRLEFEKLTPLYPAERLRLETEAGKLTARVIDLVAPLGKGQRGLVIAPPRSGTTLLLQAVANAITKNNPEVHLMVVLVDERPEDVTEMQRTVKGEVIASTFDRPAEDQTTVADLAVERAKRLVELGYDVVILLDSITRLARAFNQTGHQSGRLLAAGVDAAALQPAKQFFAAARNIENGGSLTILAAAHIETGSAADEAILAEFVGTANQEIVLSGALADKRIFPAIDITRSATRREEILMGPDEVKVTWQLRRAIANHTPQEALDVVTGKLRETSTNVEFLVQMQKSLPSGK
ncbi:transcription termination factor Rho [uncultured Amnibacterium sp.]|uniref:transcription termination factor Rho n=1 Tax=uncultured Amnibacterium sp. TaxID=1631851 RepID=UPI0035CA3B66